ncbi:MAG TPA: hypothetical protein VEK08_13030, partial [Planctomycetota bacterium]|nr:hypothetical protein [Planctomycetota bacterium]
GGALLSERLESPGSMLRCVVEVPPNARPPYILDTETAKLPVNDCSNFPPSGFLIVGGELLYYGKRTATQFQQLQRGIQSLRGGMPPRNLFNRTGVYLASIEITDSSQYDDERIVQIDDESNPDRVEWLHYGSKHIMNGKHYLVALIHNVGPSTWYSGPPGQSQNGTPHPNSQSVTFLRPFRSEFGIGGINMAHDKKAKVIPVVRMSGPQCGDQFSPYGDEGVSEVSIVERGNPRGDLRYVKQAYNHQQDHWVRVNPLNNCPQRFAGWEIFHYMGLNDFVSREYPRGSTRIMKWPSGELPDAVGAKRIVGADRNGEGKMRGHVDEIKVNTFNVEAARIAMTLNGQGISQSDTSFLIEAHDAWPTNGNERGSPNWTSGLARIEDELIFIQRATTERIQFYFDRRPFLKDKAEGIAINPCTQQPENHPIIENRTGQRVQVIRGVLGTEAVDHPVGAQIMLLEGMPVGLLNTDIGGNADTFSISDARGFPNEGYVWIDNEVLSYTKKSGNTFSGCRYFRGRYGTAEAEHERDSIVRCLPFRYWDREGRTYDGEGLAYIQAGYYASDALWDGIDLTITGTEQLPSPPAHVRPRVLARFDGNPNWSATPTNEDGGLFEFKGREGKMVLRTQRNAAIRADQAELRVFWMYTRGAFLPGQDWKRTFSIEKMRMTYRTPLIMRRLDEVEKR